MISNVLVVIVDFVWGLPLVFLLLGGGLYLVLLSRFRILKGFFHALRLISGRYHHEGDERAPGQISHFKALTNALSATVGMGNIAGVAVAVTQGGPGAIFWMWLAALVGMNTKFFECTLSLMYRGKDYHGEVQGGPMYVIQQALPKALWPMAFAFALFGLVGTLATFNSNQLCEYVFVHYSVPKILSGIVVALVVAYILAGGVRRIADVTSRMVPFMCVLYVVACLGIILANISGVPAVFGLIFKEAFSGSALYGGAIGMSVRQIMIIGFKRAAYSNEAGIGTAPMAHGNAQTKEPIAEGLVAMVGPFLDTIVICTMTALVILLSLQPSEMEGLTGVLLTQHAFQKTYHVVGNHVLGMAIFLFAFSTILGVANYNKKCWDFAFKGKGIFGKWFHVIFFSGTIVFGAIAAPDDMINFMDIGFALMAIPNMICTLILAPKVVGAMQEYFRKYNI